jgi:hypothetical protein
MLAQNILELFSTDKKKTLLGYWPTDVASASNNIDQYCILAGIA